MAYQVLARKWRPQTFSAVVGQEPVVTALENALRESRIAQAYLFSGIRGVGKTTVARLLAKSLDCEKGPTPEPCNECVPCREITQGADLDVLEIDAATYSKVEQVRDLTESLRYGPARDRFKVVILDEVHRLSRQAFDALLKIIEEPPPHLVFIFATTEIEAVPATILSRCQEFAFRRVSVAQLCEHLHLVAEAEAITVSEASLKLVARAAEGSVRDAVALLDQLATYGGGTIADEEAAALLGGVDAALFNQILAAILAAQASRVSDAVASVEAEGLDPRHVYQAFLEHVRDGLHLALGAEPSQIALPEEQARALAVIAREAGYENMLRLLHQLLASEASVRRSEAGALALEIAWLRAAELPKLVRIEEVLAGRAALPRLAGGPAAPAAPAPAPAHDTAAATTAPPEPVRARPAVPAPEPPSPPAASADGAETKEEPPPAASTSEDAGAPAAPDAIASFLERVSLRKQALAAHLSRAERLEHLDDELLIVHAPDDDWLSDAVRRVGNRTILDEAVSETWGERCRWRLVEGDAGDDDRDETSEPAGAASAVAGEPIIQTVLDIFGGTVESVEENEPAAED